MVSILFTTAVILICAGAARRLLNRFEPEFRTELERFLFHAGIGLGLFAYVVMLLGLAQALDRWSIAVVLAIVPAIALFNLIRLRGPFALTWTRPSLNKDRDWTVAFILLGISAIGFWVLVKALAPPTSDDWDSLAYHLAVPKLYLKHGGIYYIPFTSHSNFPFTVEMLYTAALSFGLVPAAKLFHFACWVFSLLAVFVIGRVYYGVRAGVTAALIFAVIPAASWEATTAYIDLAAVFYTLLAVSAVLAYSDSRDRRWIVFAGLGAGLAASTKMTALGSIGLLMLWAFAAGSWAVKNGWRKAGPDALILGLIAAVTASPWYIKSWVQTGNPVYPFFYEIFGGRGWSEKLAETYRSLQMQFGMGHAPSDFIMAPWNLAVYSERFYDRPGLYVGFVLLAFLPLIVLMAVRDHRARSLALFSTGLGLMWFAMSHQSRYLLPAFGVLAVPAAAALYNIPGIKISRIAGTAALILSTTFAFLFTAQMGASAFHVAVGSESQQDYLRRTLDTYRMTEYINDTLPSDAKVVLLNDTRGFYLERDYLWGDWAHNTVIPYDTISSAEQFVQFLRSINITHALIRGIHNLPEGHETDLITSAVDKGYLRPAAFDENFPVAVYEVAPD